MNEAIAKAMIGIGSLAADKRNKHDGYDYISSDKILEEIGKTLGGLSIVVIPGITGVTVDKYDREDDKFMFCANVSMQMTVRAGENEITVPWFGSGVDYRVPDKAVYKGITSGHSYFLRKLLMVGIGNEDGEHQPTEPLTKKPAEKPMAERPYPAMTTKTKLLMLVGDYRMDKKKATKAQDKAFIITYASLFPDDKARYAVTEWLFGKTSSKQLEDAEKLALIKWMEWEEVEGGGYIPSQFAISEARIMLRQVEKNQGQKEML